MPAVLLATTKASMPAWRDAMLRLDPGLEIRLWPEAGAAAEIDAAVIWGAQYLEGLRQFPNLGLIVSMGAGVDHQFGRLPGAQVGADDDRVQ